MTRDAPVPVSGNPGGFGSSVPGTEKKDQVSQHNITSPKELLSRFPSPQHSVPCPWGHRTRRTPETLPSPGRGALLTRRLSAAGSPCTRACSKRESGSACARPRRSAQVTVRGGFSPTSPRAQVRGTRRKPEGPVGPGGWGRGAPHRTPQPLPRGREPSSAMSVQPAVEGGREPRVASDPRRFRRGGFSSQGRPSTVGPQT